MGLLWQHDMLPTFVHCTTLLAQTQHWCFFTFYFERVLAGTKFLLLRLAPQLSTSHHFDDSLFVLRVKKKKELVSACSR